MAETRVLWNSAGKFFSRLESLTLTDLKKNDVLKQA